MIKGLDISHHEGTINWGKLVAENIGAEKIEFIIFKCTEGATNVDNTTLDNALSALKKNIKIGYYHFAYPQKNIGDAKSEALFFIKRLKLLPNPTYKYPFTLDIEVNPSQIGKTEYYNWILEFITTFKTFTNSPLLIYGSPNFLNSVLPPNHELGKLPLWLAHYQTNSPRLPVGWNSWSLWQKTDLGEIPGIKSYVDVNLEK